MRFFEKALELEGNGISIVVVTLVASRGYAPQDPGAKAIVSKNGLEYGTVGGGKVEARAITHSQEILAQNKGPVEHVTWNLQRDIGMSCGGEVQFVFEKFIPPSSEQNWTIAVFGAGHVAQALIRQLLELECKVICIDSRKEWLSKLPQSPRLKIVSCDQEKNAVAEIPQDAFCVVMTRGHATDLPVLETVFKRGLPPYVGVIGSAVKAIRIKKDLEALGISAEAIKTLHCPMGISINNKNHPAEIAISISAELIQVRGRSETM